MGSGYQYTLVFVNHSSRTADVCVFQQDPLLLSVGSLETVAWLVQPANPTTVVTFQWTADYDFVWSAPGKLAPGVQVSSAQVWPADLSTKNQVTFTKTDGAYTFQNQTQGLTAGRLIISEISTIPAQQAAVGIGAAGAATFVVQAQPNLSLTFTPSATPQYWITFGSYLAGQVLDVTGIPANEKIQVVFPFNVYSMTATLNADNTGSVVPTTAVNAAFLAARKKDPMAVWGKIAV
jgi:hypothetical protein